MSGSVDLILTKPEEKSVSQLLPAVRITLIGPGHKSMCPICYFPAQTETY